MVYATRFEAGEVRAQAEVDTVAKTQMSPLVPRWTSEAVRFGEVPIVAVGRRIEQEKDAARGDHPAMVLDVLSDPSGLYW